MQIQNIILIGLLIINTILTIVIYKRKKYGKYWFIFDIFLFTLVVLYTLYLYIKS